MPASLTGLVGQGDHDGPPDQGAVLHVGRGLRAAAHLWLRGQHETRDPRDLLKQESHRCQPGARSFSLLSAKEYYGRTHWARVDPCRTRWGKLAAVWPVGT